MTHANKTALAVAVMAAGVLVISVAYAVGRNGTAGTGHDAAIAAYWLGEAVIFAAPTAFVLRRSELAEAQAAWLVIALATTTYLVKYLYSPAAFGFSDEFLHWRTLTTLLTSHHLFGVNYALPVSPGYPGIEVVASALIDLTGLGVFPAGLMVAGLAHLVFTVALYTLFRLVAGSTRAALGAVTIYATNPHYQVFDAIFGYQTLALAFFALALLALRKGAWAWAAVFTAATAVTHHVTSYVLAATAALIAAAGLFLGDRKGFTAPASLASLAAALIALWTWRVVPGTVSYLSPEVSQFTDGVRAALTGHIAKSGVAPLPDPLSDRVASDLVAITIMMLIPFGWRQIWRTRLADAWAVALGAGAAAYYPCVALPFVTSDGSELAGRLLTFVYIPVAYTLAVALVARPPTFRRWIGGTAAAIILVAGGISMGWPPWWERLPGGYVVDGFESGITAESLAAATWAGTRLPPGRRVAADYTNNLLFGTLGGQNPVNGMAALFCGRTWTLADATLARQQAVRYLVVDLRTGTDRAPNGSAFIGTPTCPTPIPAANLAKFDAIHGMARIYDSGNILVYNLSAAAYAP